MCRSVVGTIIGLVVLLLLALLLLGFAWHSRRWCFAVPVTILPPHKLFACEHCEFTAEDRQELSKHYKQEHQVTSLVPSTTQQSTE